MMNKVCLFVSCTWCGLLIASVTAFGQADWSTFRNSTYSFRFVHQPDWTVATPRGPNVRASVNAPKASAPANCNVVVRDASELASLTQDQLNKELMGAPFTEAEWADMMRYKFPDVKVIESRVTKIDNRPAQYGVLDYSYETVQAKLYSRSANALVFSPGRFWHLGCTTAGRTEAEARLQFQHWAP